MKKIILILFFSFNFLFSHEIYKEIRINNDSYPNTIYFQSLGIDIDHDIVSTEYIQFFFK